MIAEGTEAGKVTAEQIAAVASDVAIFIKTHKISRKEVARTIGYSPGVISEFLAGDYAGNKGQVAIDLEAWLVEEEPRRTQPATTQFVWTTVAQTIKATANYCLDHRTIGMVYGPDTSGLGKTTALEAIHQILGERKSTLITIAKVDASPSGLIHRLCEGLRIGNTGGYRAHYNKIVEKLKDRSHILLIDEAHNLRGATGDKPFYILKDLFDATNVAQLWCGTADLVAYLQRRQTRDCDESLAQIRRRIFPRCDLMEAVRIGGGGGEPLVTIEQVREMFARSKLKLTGQAARFLCKICNSPGDMGSIGLCVRIVEYATWLGEMRRATSLEVPLLQEALASGITSNSAALMLARMPEGQVQQARKVG